MAEITNMERNPYANQGGNPAIIQEEQEIEIVLPSEGDIEIEDLLGGMEEFSYNHNENLVESLDSDELDSIAGKVIEGFEADKESRGEWEDTFEKGFDLLGLKLRETTEPFEGACTAVHPLLIESAVKFQSKAIQELFPSKGPVKTQIIGNPTIDKDRQATRVMNFMNYQLTDQMPEYFSELERMLFNLPIFGSAFKKTYWDMSFERPMSEFVPIEQFYVSNFASDLQNAERYTHVVYRSPNDLKRDIESGMYTLDHYDEDRLPQATPVQPTPITSKMNMIMGIDPNYDEEPQYTILEQHCYLEIEEEIDENDDALTVALPYIVSVDEHSRKVLCIRRNWAETDPRKEKLLWFTHYRFVPGFGFYGLGFIHFLGNLTATATSAVRNLIDAGQFATLPGGFKARGVRIVGSNDAIAPGEFKEVEATGIDLTKSIIPLPYKEPSSTLMQMLQFVTAAGQKFADSTEQVIADSTNYGPVGTTLALLEASTKFFSAIHKRLHYSQRQELKILSRINFDFLPNEYPYDLANIEGQIFKNDFDGRIDIIPVSDPNVPSASHRLAMAQTVMQMAQQAPAGMYNLREINRTMLDAAGIENPDKFLIPEQEPQPLDPISDINAIAQGMPIKSFPGQDHQAHIAVKQAFLADPTLGQNEMMQSLVPVLQANIREHMIMQYEEQMAGMLQNGVAEAGSGSPEAISKITQGAAQEILQNNQRMAAMGTPEDLERMTLDLQRQQLELERERLKIDAAQKAADIAIDEEKLDLQRDSLEIEAAEKLAKIKGVAKDRNIVAESKAADRDDKFLLKMMDLLIKETGTTVEKLKEEVVLRPEIYQEGGITVPMIPSKPSSSADLYKILDDTAVEMGISVEDLLTKVEEASPTAPVQETEIDETVTTIESEPITFDADRTGPPISSTTGERFDPLEAQREAALRKQKAEDEKLMEEAILGYVPARPPVTQEAEKSIFHLTYKDFRDRLRHAETGGEDDPWIFTHSKKDKKGNVSSAFGPSQITYTLAGDVLKKVPKKDKGLKEYIQKFIKQGKTSYNLENRTKKRTKANLEIYGRGKSGNIPLEEHKKYYPRLEEMAIDQKRKIRAVNNIDDLLKAWYPGAATDKAWRERFNLGSEEG